MPARAPQIVLWLMLSGAAVAAHAAGAADGAGATTKPAAAASGPAADGEALFRGRCGYCHLDGGTGTLMLERRLGRDQALLADRVDLDSAKIASAVRHGTGSMPHLTRIEVSDAELQAISAWLMRPAAQRAAK